MRELFRAFCVGVVLFICYQIAFGATPTSRNKDFIPPQAYTHRDTIKYELVTHWAEVPSFNYLPALIEHESCISLTHRRCWNSTSELRSSRELGVGLGQITKAFREDGSIRFDSLQEMKTRYRHELRDAAWETIHGRPDVQIRMMVLMSRDNYRKLYEVKDEYQRLSMTDAAYNGGLGAVQKARRICGMQKGCDPGIWFGHVNKMPVKSTKAIYGNRSPTDIWLHHVDDVMKVRMPKYVRLGYF